MNMKLPKVLAVVLLVLALGVFSVTPALAVPVMSPIFSGSVTIDGDDALVDTTISAEIEDVEVASVETSVVGHYAIGFDHDDAYLGKTVVFKVNGVVAGEYEEYVSGWDTPTVTLDLVVTGPLGLTAEAGSYSGAVGEEIALEGSASGGTLPYTYAWDLDNNGTYETTGATVSHSWDIAGTHTIGLRVTDSVPDTAFDTATVTVSEDAFDPWIYDTDNNNVISKDEAEAAITDYNDGAGTISKDNVLRVLILYFS